MLRDLVLIGAVFFAAVNAKVCPSMDVRNRPENLEKLRNCTIIMGRLMIVLMHTMEDGSVFDKYVFPELVEVEENIIIFSVRHLTSIGQLFPNLRVIRGKALFKDYALVIHKMEHLREIGLTNLQRIDRGGVRIDLCPKLCFADTINWKAIGDHDLQYFKTAGEKTCENQFCPGECRGYCWNNTHCQKFTVPGKCHPQCIGCSREGSSKHCNTCKYYEDHGECVKTCPPLMFANDYSMKCLTREECNSLLNDGSWWVFEQNCVKECPIGYEEIDTPKKRCKKIENFVYTKVCNGTVIDSLSALESMALCTHINGSLSIRSISKDYLGDDVLEKNLGRIVSISGYLKISRSSAVRSLEFFKSLRVIKGVSLENRKAFFVFENPNLQRLWDFDSNYSLVIQNGTVAFYANPQLCYSEVERFLNYTDIKNKTAVEEISKFSNSDKSTCNPKNMTVTIVNKSSTNITISWQVEDVKDKSVTGYMVHYVEAFKVRKEEENKGSCDSAWNYIFVHNNTAEIKSLSAYTRYGYYIETYRTIWPYREQTPIYYFTTSSDDPTAPLNLNAIALNDSTIKLEWKSPTLMNGNFSHYSVTMFLQEDYIPLIEQRDYCRYPHQELDEEIEQQPKIISSPIETNCPCLAEEENRFLGTEVTCGVDKNDCHKYTYFLNDESFGEKMNIHRVSLRKRAPTDESSLISQRFRIFNVTDEKDTVLNLRHFSVYLFYVTACNWGDYNDSHCSGFEMASNRTLKKEDADIVEEFFVTVDDTGIFLQWTEPLEVNSVIVSYQIEHRRIDLEDAKPSTECITRQQHLKMGQKYQLVGLSSGKYRIRVRATSLAGPSKFSPWKTFDISPPDAGLRWVYVLIGIVIILVVIVGLYVVRYWYRRKYYFDSNHLITSVNPDYAGPIYEEDDWEIDRNDIEIIKELGQGSFGMVYEGLIKSKGYPCAIKTVNESTTMTSRMEFLNEGAVMKSFNDAHHVIKLLGIVSRGQPPLVIMELMERGDLKSYLRRCREPSQNLTTNEMYRMAAEIADGMAYLTAKKFVHRDLAARNCMVGADRTVKIGDFGMARDIYETDYYRKETVGLLPVRWMAPESLADGVFTSDSDVWSYGIVLWEMATLAEQPYQGLSNEQVFHFVKNRGRLERPPECSDLLYEVMDACWMWRPNDRPTFADIVDKLVDHVGQAFRLVSFCFSQQGMDLALNAGPRVYNPPAMIALPEDDIFGRYDASEEEVSLYLN